MERKEPTISLSRAQKQIDWIKQKLYLDSLAESAKRRVLKRGQVYWCDFGVGIGSEIEKNRPAIIVQDDLPNRCSSNTVVVPITHNDSGLPCMVPLDERLNPITGEIILDGQANTSHIVTVCKSRIGDCICILSDEEMQRIDLALANSLSISHYYNDIKTEKEKIEEELHDVSFELDAYKKMFNSIHELFKLDIEIDLFDFLKNLKESIDKNEESEYNNSTKN